MKEKHAKVGKVGTGGLAGIAGSGGSGGLAGLGGSIGLDGSEPCGHLIHLGHDAHHAHCEDNDIPIVVHMNDKDISTIIDKALNEGSCLHWCYDIQQKYPDARYLENEGVLMVYAFNDVYELTKQKFIHGIQQALPYLSPAVIKGNKLDVSMIDSDSGDFIIQLALFENILYD